MSVKPLNILINGWYGHNNAGDDAILQVFIEQAQAQADCRITVLSERPDHVACPPGVDTAYHPAPFGAGILSSLLKGIWFRHVRRVADCELFVLGGGGLLRDNTSWRNLLRLLDEIWLAKLFGRKVMLYAIGVGPFTSRGGRWVIGRSARLCDLITVRSERGAELLRGVGVAPERIRVVADPAFLLEPCAPDDPELAALLAGGDKIGLYPTVSLVAGWPDDAHVRRLAAALDTLVERESASFVALPMRVCDELDDVKIADAIRAAMRHPEALHVHRRRLEASELKWATGRTRMNITVRLHAMIFSLGTETPVVAINYEPKVAGVFASFDSPRYLVEMDDALAEHLPDAVSHCLANLQSYTRLIRERRVAALEDAAKTFSLMQQLHRAPSATSLQPSDAPGRGV